MRTLFFRGRRAALIPLAMLLVALLLILHGDTLAYRVRFGVHDAFGANVFLAANFLAPRAPGALGPAIVVSYVFLQSIHYMAWLAWIPDSVGQAEGTRTFKMSTRGLVNDFGAIGLALLLLASVAVILGAAFNPSRARAAYLSLSAFHGYLELAAAAYLATRASARPRSICPA